MAFGNQPNGSSNYNKSGYQGKAQQGRPTSTSASTKKYEKDYLVAFKNKGKGYSVVTKEDVVIPAGTRVSIFENVIKGKDGTEYQVLSVKKLPARDEA